MERYNHDMKTLINFLCTGDQEGLGDMFCVTYPEYFFTEGKLTHYKAKGYDGVLDYFLKNEVLFKSFQISVYVSSERPLVLTLEHNRIDSGEIIHLRIIR